MIFWITDRDTGVNLCVIDSFESAIWTDRWSEAGEFEIVVHGNEDVWQYIKIGNYVHYEMSDHTMIIETVYQNTDKNGRQLVFSGRSAECILSRRVMYTNPPADLRQLFEVIDYTMATNFYIPDAAGTGGPQRVYNITIKETFTKWYDIPYEPTEDLQWTNVYELISTYAAAYKKGFLVYSSDDTIPNSLTLFDPTDRSYSQSQYPPVVFSRAYENLTKSQLLESRKDEINVVYAIYKRTIGSGDSQKEEVYVEEVGKVDGIERREGAITVNLEDDRDNPLKEDEIRSALQSEGDKYLEQNATTHMLSGDVEAYRQFIYGRDFFLGDIVELEDPSGETVRCLVSEIVFSEDDAGEKVTPTFIRYDT